MKIRGSRYDHRPWPMKTCESVLRLVMYKLTANGVFVEAKSFSCSNNLLLRLFVQVERTHYRWNVFDISRLSYASGVLSAWAGPVIDSLLVRCGHYNKARKQMPQNKKKPTRIRYIGRCRYSWWESLTHRCVYAIGQYIRYTCNSQNQGKKWRG